MIPSPETTATVMACIFAIIPVGWMVGAVITQLVIPMASDWIRHDWAKEDEA